MRKIYNKIKELKMPAKEKQFHILTEALSVFIAAPFLFYAARYHPDTTIQALLRLFAVSLVVVDGYLLSKYEEW